MPIATILTTGWSPKNPQDPHEVVNIHTTAEQSADYSEQILRIFNNLRQKAGTQPLHIKSTERLFRRRVGAFGAIKKFVKTSEDVIDSTLQPFYFEINVFCYAFLKGAKNMNYILKETETSRALSEFWRELPQLQHELCGKIISIGVFFVMIETPDNDLVSIPTHELWSSVLLSINGGDRSSMCVMEFFLAPLANQTQRQQAEDIIWESVQASPYYEISKPLQIYTEQSSTFIKLTAKAFVASTYNEFLFKSEINTIFLNKANKKGIPLAARHWRAQVVKDQEQDKRIDEKDKTDKEHDKRLDEMQKEINLLKQELQKT